MSNFVSNVYIDHVSPNSILGHTMQQEAFVYTRTLYNTSYIYTQESLIFGIFLQSQIQLEFLGKKKKRTIDKREEHCIDKRSLDLLVDANVVLVGRTMYSFKDHYFMLTFS